MNLDKLLRSTKKVQEMVNNDPNGFLSVLEAMPNSTRLSFYAKYASSEQIGQLLDDWGKKAIDDPNYMKLYNSLLKSCRRKHKLWSYHLLKK